MAIRTTRECKAEAGTGREGTSQRPAQRGAGTERRRPGVHAHLDDDDPARARLAFRPDGLACALSARPGRACMALRLALEWLYLYDGGSWPCAAVPDFMCREVGWSGGYSVVLCGFPHSFAQSFVHPYASAYTKAPVKETGWSPKEKRLWGGDAPVRFRDPPASPTRVGAATRPLRCPLRGRIESLAPRARGLGWRKFDPVKVLCPALL